MYNVSVSPHIRDKSSTQKIMIDVCIALVPTLAFGVWRSEERRVGKECSKCVTCYHFIRCKLRIKRACV